MKAKKKIHIGQNIRKIRLLRGMKQETFAKELGIAQQNVSKMENKAWLTDEKIAQAAKVLRTTVEAIKGWNEDKILQSNLSNEQPGYNFQNAQLEKIIELYDKLIEYKNIEIKDLKAELKALRSNAEDRNTPGSSQL